VKYLCESCDRLAEASGFRREAGMLVLICTRCGAETRTAWAEPAAGSPGAVTADRRGLQTRAARSEADAEPATAAVSHAPVAAPPPAPAPAAPRVVALHAVPPLTFPGEDPFTVPEDRCPKCVAPKPLGGGLSCHQCGLVFANFVAVESEPSGELKAAWKELAAHWDDAAFHDRVLAGAAVRGDLASAGRLYRIHLARRPRDPMASRGRDEVIRLAATTTPLRPDPLPVDPEKAKKVLVGVAAIFLAFSLILVTYFLVARR